MKKMNLINMMSIAVMATMFAGCGKVSPTSLPLDNTSDNQSQYETVPTLPAGVTAKTITLTPNTLKVHVGETKKIAVYMSLSNGNTSTEPRLVRWAVADPQAGVIDSMGQFTPKLPRTTKIVATVGSTTAEIPVTIEASDYNWQQVSSPTHEDLYSVKMVSDREAWAVGENSTMLHLVNSYWQSAQVPVEKASLRGVDFADAGRGWAVGSVNNQAAILGYYGGQWNSFNTGVAGILNTVDVIDNTHAWAGGKDGSGRVLLMKFNGQTWSRDNSYSGRGHINSISMVGSIGWAVGSDGNNALILHYENGKWQEDRLPALFSVFQSSELRAIKMINAEQGYAVGVRDSLVSFPKGLVLKFDARGSQTLRWTNWKRVDGADTEVAHLDQVPLNGIALTSGDAGWFLGATITPKVLLPKGTINDVYGNLLDWDGTNYRIDTKYRKTNLSREFLGVDLLPQGEGVIVGRGGYIMQRQYDWQSSDTTNTSSDYNY